MASASAPLRRRLAAIAGVCAAAIAACTPALPHKRTWISDELSARTGSGLRTQTQDTRFLPPPQVTLSDGLTPDEAVAVALWNNAAYQAQCAELSMARADLADAAALPNPVASVLFPFGSNKLELGLKWGFWWLWRRPKKIAIARVEARKVAETIVAQGLELAQKVKVAHAELLLAEEMTRIASEAETAWAELSRVAGEQSLPGRKDGAIALATIRADVASARAEADQAASAQRRATARLRELLGMPAEMGMVLSPALATPLAGDLRAWTDVAIAVRPDLRASALELEAAGKRVGLGRSRILALVGVLEATHTDRGWDLGVGVEASIPLFNRSEAGPIRHRAELERAAWSYVALRRQIDREVADAYARLEEATRALTACDDEVVPARTEARDLAVRAYERGETGYVSAVEASRALTAAHRRRAELSAEIRRAAAELERAVGGRPPSRMVQMERRGASGG